MGSIKCRSGVHCRAIFALLPGRLSHLPLGPNDVLGARRKPSQEPFGHSCPVPAEGGKQDVAVSNGAGSGPTQALGEATRTNKHCVLVEWAPVDRSPGQGVGGIVLDHYGQAAGSGNSPHLAEKAVPCRRIDVVHDADGEGKIEGGGRERKALPVICLVVCAGIAKRRPLQPWPRRRRLRSARRRKGQATRRSARYRSRYRAQRSR